MWKARADCSWRFKKHGRVLEWRGKGNPAMGEIARSQTIKKPPMSINPLCVNGQYTRAQHQGSQHSKILQLASHPLSLSCVVLSELLKLLKLWFLPQETVGSSSPQNKTKWENYEKQPTHGTFWVFKHGSCCVFVEWAICWVFSLWGRNVKMKSV